MFSELLEWLFGFCFETAKIKLANGFWLLIRKIENFEWKNFGFSFVFLVLLPPSPKLPYRGGL